MGARCMCRVAQSLCSSDRESWGAQLVLQRDKGLDGTFSAAKFCVMISFGFSFSVTFSSSYAASFVSWRQPPDHRAATLSLSCWQPRLQPWSPSPASHSPHPLGPFWPPLGLHPCAVSWAGSWHFVGPRRGKSPSFTADFLRQHNLFSSQQRTA